MTDHPHTHTPDPDLVARETVDDLRAVLAEHGIKLPSLGRDFGHPPLVILGNCNLATARALVDVLRAKGGR
ncbi:hypothetical protein [Streptomyces lichenis]|uniref:Uncharacterized protein n=1 Tax=Streptomyces lichenis TaxID=2306967 RepID=A0ABT0I4A7_9ACTN|nr:hypothetical protein [Streptomyces lichenis]MCK8676157.1 hypothetical protein [Streptomyces lichenis]